MPTRNISNAPGSREAQGPCFFPAPRPGRALARLGAEIPGVLVSIEAMATLDP